MWTIWFQDGQGRQCILDESGLREAAYRFGFCADEVLRNGEVSFLDDDGDEIGGVFRDSLKT